MPDMPNSGLPGAEGPPTESAKMIVFGVSFSTTKEGFREYWAQYGELAECELMFGRDGRYVQVIHAVLPWAHAEYPVLTYRRCCLPALPVLFFTDIYLPPRR